MKTQFRLHGARTRFIPTISIASILGAMCVLGSCRSPSEVPEKGAVLLQVMIPPGGGSPDELRAWIYDKTGVLFRNVRFPEAGEFPATTGTDLGTVLIQAGVAVGDLRVHLRGFLKGTRILDGTKVFPEGKRDQVTSPISMNTAVPVDDDGDDVPDVIDDCLTIANPDQGGCPGQGMRDGAVGDLGSDGASAEGDAGANDASANNDGAAGRGATGGMGGVGTGGKVGTGGALGTGGVVGTGGIIGTTGGTVGSGGKTGTGGAVAATGGAPATGGAVGSGGKVGTGGVVGTGGGCGLTPTTAAEGYVTLSMVEGGVPVSRQFWLSRPATYDPRRLHKLIIGLGSAPVMVDNVRTQLNIQTTGAQAKDDEIFVYPIARSRRFGTWGTKVGWQLGPGARDSNAAGLDDLAFIDALRDDVTAKYCVDAQRVFVVGYGWGSDFAHALACLRGDRIKAIVGAANNGDYYVKSPVISCVGEVNTWTMNGKGDTVQPVALGLTTLAVWRREHGCRGSTQPVLVSGPVGNEDCVAYDGCSATTRWCAYDASFGSSAPNYLGREALAFFRTF